MGQLRGKCPMGCGETLHFSNVSGVVECIAPACPRPLAVTDLLANPLTDHKVEIDEHGFAIKHPLHERIEDKLFECELQKWLSDLGQPPVRYGLYRVTPLRGSAVLGTTDAVVSDGWMFEKITEMIDGTISEEEL